MITHGHTCNRKVSPEFKAWDHMLQRCLNPKHPRFDGWGGRGIVVCDRWMKFENFLADMGRRPSPHHSLDRIDNDGNYEPDNCRWATPAQQRASKRPPSNMIVYQGRTLRQWADQLGITTVAAYKRYSRGSLK